MVRKKVVKELDLEEPISSDETGDDFLKQLAGSAGGVAGASAARKKKVRKPIQEGEVKQNVVRKKGDAIEFSSLEINSPSSLWPLGAIKLHVAGPLFLADVRNARAEAAELFEEMWGSLVSSETPPTLKAVNYAKSLVVKAGEDVEEYAWADMTATEVSGLIQEFGAEKEEEKLKSRGKRRAAKRSGSGRGKPRRASKSSSSSGRFTIKNPNAPATDAQLSKIEQLCKDANEDVPDDLDELTKGEASDVIQEMM